MQLVGMAAVNLILKLCLFICFGFTESSADPTAPKPDLECINDFLKEMVCRLTPEQLHTCSEYSLNASRDTDKEQFECDFKLEYSVCGCTLHVNSGFVLNENFKTDVMRKKTLLLTQYFSATNTIKPIKPNIVSVDRTQNGNFLIVLGTKYKNEIGIDENLISQLIYYVKGRNESVKHVNLTRGQKSYEIIGRTLESVSEYIVMARVKYDLSPNFSDYSDSYTFTTPMSPQDILKIVISIICVILICVIITVYFFYTMFLADRWQKVPTPKIATSFVKQVPNLLSFQNEFSPVHLDSSKLLHVGEKICPESSLADIRGQNSLGSLGKDGNSADVIYGQAGNESISSTSRSCGQVLMSDKYKNLQTSSDDRNDEQCEEWGKCGNSSGISNKFYMLSFSDKFCNSPLRNGICDFNENESVVSALTTNLAPMIQVDFEYGPCSGCSGSENTSPNQSTPSSNDITVVPGYQSVNELDCTPTEQPFVSSHNDVNLIMDKLICSKNSQKIASESTILPVENGYKDFRSLLRNSAEQQFLNAEPELKHLCGPPLHTVPGIQIDCSYHKV